MHCRILWASAHTAETLLGARAQDIHRAMWRHHSLSIVNTSYITAYIMQLLVAWESGVRDYLHLATHNSA